MVAALVLSLRSKPLAIERAWRDGSALEARRSARKPASRRDMHAKTESLRSKS